MLLSGTCKARLVVSTLREKIRPPTFRYPPPIHDPRATSSRVPSKLRETDVSPLRTAPVTLDPSVHSSFPPSLPPFLIPRVHTLYPYNQLGYCISQTSVPQTRNHRALDLVTCYKDPPPTVRKRVGPSTSTLTTGRLFTSCPTLPCSFSHTHLFPALKLCIR